MSKPLIQLIKLRAMANEGVSYGEISFLALQAVIQSVVVCLIGYWASIAGYLGRSTQKNLSTLNVQILTPALIFSKMAKSLSVSALVDVAVIPVFYAISTGIAYLCGRSLSRWMKLPPNENNFVTAMAVFGNSNSVPVSTTVALAYSLPMLRWSDIPGDNADNVASRGLLYLLIFQQLGQMLRWSWGYNTLLAKPQVDEPPTERINLSETEEESGYSFTQLAYMFAGELRQFMNPPLWSMLAAIIVASVPALKHEMYEKEGFVAMTLARAIQNVGSTAIPLILIVLGSNLAPPVGEDAHLDLQSSPRYAKIITASMLSRMILPSIFLLPIIALSVKYLHISILDDPIFLVATFLLTVSPPAIQLSQICQINQIFEREMAGVLFWGYAVFTLPSTIFVVVVALEVLNWAGITN